MVVHGNWWQRWRYRRTLSTLGAPPEHLFSVPSQHPCGCVTAYYEQGDQYVYLGVCREHPDQPKWKKTRKVIR